jgi:outer membrane lipoprotein-sorting protein
MRWLIAVVGWVLLAPVALAQDAAQKLYEAMDQKIAKAKAHKISFDLDALDHDETIKVKGTVIVAAGNRANMSFQGQEGKRSIKGKLVSDGKTIFTQMDLDGKPETKTKPVSDKLFATLVSYLSRTGLFVGFETMDRENPKDAAELKLSAFKSAGKEKVGSRDANVIEYTLTPPDGKGPASCKLWLDTQTNLPLKRTLEANRDGKLVFRVAETYAQWELDPKLPDGTFTLPK